MFRHTALLMVLGVAVTNPTDAAEDEHPFLIVRKEQFEALRAKADREPWKSMKGAALKRTTAGFDPGTIKSNTSLCIEYSKYLGAVSLAYVLEPDHARQHADRVRKTIIEGLAAVSFKGAWEGAAKARCARVRQGYPP